MPSHVQSRAIPPAALALGLAGLIPFAAAALAQVAPLPLLSEGEGQRLALIYGALILSFLGGVRWGAALFTPSHGEQGRDLLGSVLPSLAGLAAFFLPDVLGLSLLIAGFLMQALWDVLSVEAGRLPPWFGKLRMILTSGAVPSLIVALLARLI